MFVSCVRFIAQANKEAAKAKINEMFYGFEYTFKSLDELQNYIEYYNDQRIITKLKGLIPVEYRNQSLYTNL